jgi:hypothetical protein
MVASTRVPRLNCGTRAAAKTSKRSPHENDERSDRSRGDPE